ncbi:MAG: response regulator transcription factor [Pseudomonadota bacterium]
MADPHTVSLVIADDHAIVREGLRTLLEDEPGFAILGEGRDGAEAVRLVRDLKPDVVLMDVAMPELDGVAAAAEIAKLKVSARVVLLTSSLGTDLKLQEALDAGVTGYLLKDISRADLVQALRAAAAGAPTFHPEVQQQLIRRAVGDKPPHEDLTARERDVLVEIARGKSNKAIAFDLDLTEGTVKGHVSAILSKLAVDDRTQAALYAVRQGLVEP